MQNSREETKGCDRKRYDEERIDLDSWIVNSWLIAGECKRFEDLSDLRLKVGSGVFAKDFIN